MCMYHSNFIESIVALHKYVPNLPDYNNGFAEQFLCDQAKKACWFGRCNDCNGISIEKLTEMIDTPFNTDVEWLVWKKNKKTKRVEQNKEKHKLSALLVHIVSISPQFLRHHYVKREQSDTFNQYDRQRASSTEFVDEGLLQVDFAENYVCESQNEVQSAHWNQKQLSLFTTALYYNGGIKSKVFVSDSNTHTKETIVPYLHKLLSALPDSLKHLKIWSDGPSSQFKNKFIAAVIPVLEDKFGIKITWNYFATSHGKGCVDGIGATTKIIVRKHVRARDCIVNNASDFVDAFNRTPSDITVEEVNEADFDEINSLLGTTELYANAKNIPDVSQAHQIKVIDGKIVTSETSKEGYTK